jgi:hypothetical protein
MQYMYCTADMDMSIDMQYTVQMDMQHGRVIMTFFSMEMQSGHEANPLIIFIALIN